MFEGNGDKLASGQYHCSRSGDITHSDAGRGTADNACCTNAARDHTQGKASGGTNEGIFANGAGINLIGVFLVMEEVRDSPNLVRPSVEDHLRGNDLATALTGLKFAMNNGTSRDGNGAPIGQDIFRNNQLHGPQGIVRQNFGSRKGRYGQDCAGLETGNAEIYRLCQNRAGKQAKPPHLELSPITLLS